MKKFLLLSLIILSFIYNSSGQVNISFEASILPMNEVYFNPIVNIAGVEHYDCHWTFGDGHESDDPNPTHPYGNYGFYLVQLTVTYFGPASVPYPDPEPFSFTVSQWVSLVPDYSYPQQLNLRPSISAPTGIIYAGSLFDIPCSINSVYAGPDYTWELFVNGKAERVEISASIPTIFEDMTKDAGVYTLQLRVTAANNPIVWAESQSVTIQVGSGGVGSATCPDKGCFYSELYLNKTVFKENTTEPIICNTSVLYNSFSTVDECENIDIHNSNYSSTPYAWGIEWTIKKNGTLPNNIPYTPVISPDLRLPANHRDYEVDINNLERGEYILSYRYSVAQLYDINLSCTSTGASAVINIKPPLLLDNENKNENILASNEDKNQYNAKFPIAGGTNKIEISGPENCNGTILVDGDWISIDKFNNTELTISCNASTNEDRNGRIIITFPDTYEPVTLKVFQSRTIYEVDNSNDLALAMQNSEDGATIILNEGTYNTPIQILGKNITLASKFQSTGDPYFIDNTIIDAGGAGSVVKIQGDGTLEGTTKIIGMHLTGGNADKGGGIFCSNANLELDHVLIHGNYGGKGGGIYSSNAKINADHITLTGNDAVVETQIASTNRKFGHMVYLRNATEIVFNNSIMGGSGTDTDYGGVYFDLYSPRCSFDLIYSILPGSGTWLIDSYYFRSSNIVYYQEGKALFGENRNIDNDRNIGYEDPANQNYWLGSDSYYRYRGTDGTDLGALFHTASCRNCDVISVAPSSLSFDNLLLGENSTKIVEVTNIVDYTINVIPQLALFDDINQPFPVPLDVVDYSIVPSKLVLKKGETKKIYVTFAPQTFGSKIGRIDISVPHSTLGIKKIPINGNCVTKPDLLSEVISGDLELKSGHYIWGLGYSIKNTGGTPTTASKVKYYLSPVSFVNELAVPLGEQEIGILQPNETLSPIEFNTLNIPQITQTGNYFFIAVVDAENVVDEHDEANNVLSKQISVVYSEPALTVTDVKFLDARYEFVELGSPGVQPGDNLKVYFKVSNAINELLVYNAKIYLSDNYTYDASDIELASLSGLVISPNSSTGGGYATVTIPENTETGGKFMLVRAFEEWLPEDNEQISTYSKNLEILLKPDYELFWANQPLIAFYPGEGFHSAVAIRNTSNSSSPATKIKYYLSSDANYDATDVELTTAIVDEIIWNEATSRTIDQTLIIPGGTAPGTWYITYYADPDNLVDEASETNNFIYSEIQVESHPDLLMLPLTVSANNIMAGSSISVSCSVSNIGLGAAPQSKLKFYLSENDALHHSNDIELGEILVDPLAPNATYAVTNYELAIPIETGGGTWSIIAKADGDIPCMNSWCDIKESNEDNNIAIAPITTWRQPDLYFRNASISKDNANISSFIQGTDVILGYELWHSNGNMDIIGNNTGLSYAGDSRLRCYLSSDMQLDPGTDNPLSSIILDATYGNTSLSAVLPMTIPGDLEAGQWFVIAVADADGQVDERDETNNLWVQGITVTDKPDLEIQNFTVTPQIAIQGVTNVLNFSSFIKNISPINKVSIASVLYYISNDNILSADDRLIRATEAVLSDDLQNEGANNYGSLWESETWSQGLSHGNYYLICETFIGNHAEESNLNNNIAVIPFEIQQAVDLEVLNLSLDRTTIEEGTSFTVSCSVRNNNATTSAPCTLSFNSDPWATFSNSSFSHTFEAIALGSLAQGESININKTYTVPAGTVANYFYALCDINNQNVEADKVNNNASIPIIIQSSYAPLSISVNITEPTTYGGNNGHVDCIVTGGATPFSYIWYLNGTEISTGATLQNAEAGDYMVQVSDYYGESGTKSFTVTEPNTLVSSAFVSQHVSTYNGNDGAIEIEIFSGNPPYHINFSNGYSEIWPIGKTSGTISGLSAGYYDITITEDNTAVNGNYNNHSVYINNQIDVTYSVTNVGQYGANNGAINIVNVAGALEPYTYSWTKDNVEISTQEDLTNLAPGLYTLTVKDNTGNSKSTDITVTEPNELVIEYTVTDASVTGQSDGAIDLNIVSGNPPYTFSWSNGSISEDISSLSAGEYFVTIKDIYHTTTKYITVQSPMGINAVVSQVTTYGGSNGRISCTAYGGTYPYTYTWYKNGTEYSTGDLVENITAGQYEVRVADYYGNTTSKIYVITQPNPIEGTISLLNHPTIYGGNDGAIEINITNGNPPYTILSYGTLIETWPVGKTNGTISNLSKGGHFIQIRDSKTQTSGDELGQMIVMYNPILIEPTVTPVAHYGETNGNISLLLSSGRPLVSCQWLKDGDNYETTGSLILILPDPYNIYRFVVPNLEAGIYTVVATDDISRTNFLDISVSQPKELIAEYTITNASSPDNSDGRIELTMQNGNPPYIFNWSKYDSDFTSNMEDLNNISPGRYQIQITDNSGELYSQDINIQPLKLWFTINNVKINGGSDGLLKVDSNTGHYPLTYEWTLNGDFFSSSNLLENIPAGEYSVTVTDAYGITNTATINVTEPDIWLIDYDAKDVLVYGENDGNIDITIYGGNPPFTYSWSNGSTTEDIFGISAGTYTVTITDNLGLERTESFEIHNPLFISGTKTDNQTIDGSDGSISLSCLGGYQPLELSVYKDGALFSTYLDIAVGEQTNLSNLSSANYSVVYRDSKNMMVSATYHITDPITIELTASGLTAPASNDGQLSTKITGGLPPYSYQWKKDNVLYSNEANLTTLSPGVYNLTVIDVEGRSSIANITLTDYMPTVTISGGGTVCNDGSEALITLQLTGRAPWNIVLYNGTSDITLDNISTEYYEYATNIPGTYQVVSGGDNIYPFSSILGSAIVEVAELPTATISGGGTLCQNTGTATISIDLTGEAPWDVTYTNGTLIYKVTGIAESHYEFTTDLPGTYTVTAVNDANCTGTASGTADVIVTEIPVAVLSGGKGLCGYSGPTLVNINLSGTGPWSLTYTDGTHSFDANDIISPYYEITADVAGIYSVTSLTDASGCPGVSANSVEVTLDPLPLPTAKVSGGGTICQNGTADVSINLTGTAPWNITYTDGLNSTEIFSWLNNITIPSSVAGTYQVTALSDANCTGSDFGSGAEIIVNPLLTVDLGEDRSFCEGSSITLDAGAGYQTYLWNGVSGGSQLEVTTAGSYSVEVTDNNGCIASDAIEITMNTVPVVNLGPDLILSADSYIYLTADPGYQGYEWPDNNTCRVLCVSMQYVTDYTDVWLNVTDENGCVGTDVIRLTLAAPPAQINGTTNSVTFDTKINNIDKIEDEIAKPVTYQLFPNPTDGKVSILISEPDRVEEIKVYDVRGNLIELFKPVLNKRVELDLAIYAPGIYMIRIKEKDTWKEFKVIRNN